MNLINSIIVVLLKIVWVYILYSHIPAEQFFGWFMHHGHKRMSKISFQACIVPFMSVHKESLIYKSSCIFLNVNFRAFSFLNYFIVHCYLNLFKKNAVISQIIIICPAIEIKWQVLLNLVTSIILLFTM